MSDRGMTWRTIPGYPDYEVNINGVVNGEHGRVEYENVIGSKVYLLYKDDKQFPLRPSELIQSAFPDISDDEAMQWDRIPRTAAQIRKDIVACETYHNKRIKQLYDELDRVLRNGGDVI